MGETRASSESESVARAGLVEIFGALTLATPTWSILRHPFGFDRYRDHPGASIHYLYAAIGFSTIATSWTRTDRGDMEEGGDFAPLLALINRTIAPLGPHAKLDGTDIIPVMLLLGNIVSGFTAYYACVWLTRRKTAAAAPRAAQTLAATAYLGGAASVLYGLAMLVARGDPAAPAFLPVGILLLFLFYCWGCWIRRIHGVVVNRLVGAAFPFVLALLSLAAFAGVTQLLKAILGPA